MNELTYTKLLNLTIEKYLNESSLEAYQFITENEKKVPGKHAQIFNFKYALASAAGLEKEALDIMKEAVIDHGFWYSYEYLMDDDDLKPLHQYEEFQQLALVCKEREEEAKANSKPIVKEISPNNESETTPVLVALHGDQENIELTEKQWGSAVQKGAKLVLPQSSQIQFSNGYEWSDVEKGAGELLQHISNSENNPVLLGGFSAGAQVALYTALHEQLHVNGLILVAPWLPNVKEWEDKIVRLKEQNIPCYVICGDQDEDCFACTNTFVQLLEDHQIPYTYQLLPDLDHDYPSDFDELLAEALTMMMK
ncbi:alpha/beta hydrolase [Cytobacillus spongiae]|uniref:alpha/beta hydrolase n=1 Tax=Cytobacillus spongiae TaxID=2901381 RepID=UPI001F449DD1|nr:alpha/beta family hydrolase [Cytobacillus spongiae]UII54545.1 alpha/beta hydrolase [Cytobacillus spongiae]